MALQTAQEGWTTSDSDLRKIIETAQIILNSTQTFIGFPAGGVSQHVSKQDSSDAVSRRGFSVILTDLSYSFSGLLTADLSIDWQDFPGFILNNVGIMLDLAMSDNSKCDL
jgi:hypothetical protein